MPYTQGQLNRIAAKKQDKDAALEAAQSAREAIKNPRSEYKRAVRKLDRAIEQDKPRAVVKPLREAKQAALAAYKPLIKPLSQAERALARARLKLFDQRQIEQERKLNREFKAAAKLATKAARRTARIATLAESLDLSDADVVEGLRRTVARFKHKRGENSPAWIEMDEALVTEEAISDE